jgi:hypothetical protein
MNKCMTTLVAATVSASFAVSAPAIEPGLYGIESTWDTNLYKINELTGQATFLAPASNWASCAGASFLFDELYCTDVLDDDYHWSVGTFDISTGNYTPISYQDNSANWHGLASSDAHGVCWAIDADAGNILKSLAPDGTIITIGYAGIHGRGMAYDDTHGILYAIGDGALHTVDITTGESTFIGPLGIPSNLIGLAYDENTQTLYANEGETTASLYRVSPTTGEATLVGANGYGYIDGLAWIGDSCPADFDGDGDVDTADLLFLLGAWGTPDGDVDGDNDTDTSDLLALLAAWGECP